MYLVDVKVVGDAPLLQNRFPMPDFANLNKGGTRHSGHTDRAEEWRDSLYKTSDGHIFQPASHFEAAMIKAAVNFRIQGRGRKTYKDLFASAVSVIPEQIHHGIQYTPEMQLTPDADEPLYLDIRPVVIQRARVAKIRPAFAPGWELEFQIEVRDDQIPRNIVQDVLTLAGKTCGVGDYRPRFGRFSVAKFEVLNGQ